MVERHVAPAFHLRRNQPVNVRIISFEEFKCLIGKHHAKAKGGAHGILLGYAHPHMRQATTQKNGCVETRRAAAQNFNTRQA